MRAVFGPYIDVFEGEKGVLRKVRGQDLSLDSNTKAYQYIYSKLENDREIHPLYRFSVLSSTFGIENIDDHVPTFSLLF